MEGEIERSEMVVVYGSVWRNVSFDRSVADIIIVVIIIISLPMLLLLLLLLSLFVWVCFGGEGGFDK